MQTSCLYRRLIQFGLVKIIFIVPFNLQAQIDLDKGLIGYWPFDRSGINQSPNLLPETDFELYNEPDYVFGIEGISASDTLLAPFMAMRFYGNERKSYARLENGIQTRLVSFSLWFNTNNYKGGGTLMAWDDKKGYGAFITPGGKIHAYIELSDDNRYDVYYEEKNFADGVWHNLIVTFDGNTIRIFIDGDQVFFENNLGKNKRIVYGVPSMNLGGIPSSIDEDFFIGIIDEVLIYNRPLTQEEIDIISDKGIVNADNDLETGQMLYLPFDNDEVNASPNAVEGTILLSSGGSYAESCIKSPHASGKMKFFDGHGEYLSGGKALAYPVFTLGLTFNTTSGKPSFIAGWDSLGYQIVLNPKGNTGKLGVKLWVSPNDVYEYVSETYFHDGNCHFVAISFDGEYFRVYEGGKGYVKEDNQFGPDRTVYYGGSKDFLIGDDANPSTDVGFQDRVGELYLFCRVLNKAESNDLYEKGAVNDKGYVGRIYESRQSKGKAFLYLANTSNSRKKILVERTKGVPEMEVQEYKVEPGNAVFDHLPVNGERGDFKIYPKQ